MNTIPLEPVIEALNECETQERAQYAKRLRAMPTFDVSSEMVYLQGKLDCYGLESLQEQPDETLAFIGACVKEARWQRDLCAAETERRRRRNLLPMPGAVALTPEVIQRLKSSVDLKDVVEYAGVELIKRGRQWWGLCPFHPDKHPSFAVHPDKGLLSPARHAESRAERKLHRRQRRELGRRRLARGLRKWRGGFADRRITRGQARGPHDHDQPVAL